MERLLEVMNTSFTLISSMWTVAYARRFLRTLDSTHIFRRFDPPAQHYYYLRSRDEVDAVLKQAPEEQTVHGAFDLHELTSTDARTSNTPLTRRRPAPSHWTHKGKSSAS